MDKNCFLNSKEIDNGIYYRFERREDAYRSLNPFFCYGISFLLTIMDSDLSICSFS